LDGDPVVVEDGRDVSLAVILERAGAYALRYGESFRNLVAEEAYRQWETGPPTYARAREARDLRSDIVFVRLPELAGSFPWASFRDVFEVDRRTVRDREGRLERLLATPRGSSLARVRAILDESSRYNLHQDQAYRNVNEPTLGLLFLLPTNQKRLVFKLERKGGRTIAGFGTVEVTFEEREGPTLVRDPRDDDVPARGRFWIDPERGSVLRTEIDFEGGAVVATEYRREPSLDIFVPDTMTEQYELGVVRDPTTLKSGPRGVAGRASYSNYRRFQVTSEWEVVGTKKPSELPAEPRGSVPEQGPHAP
jgi:hypothetical protein